MLISIIKIFFQIIIDTLYNYLFLIFIFMLAISIIVISNIIFTIKSFISISSADSYPG